MNIIIKKLIQYLGYFFGGIIFTIVFDPKILQNLNFSHSILFLGLISLIVFLYSSFYFKGTESDVEIFKIYRVSGNLIGIFTFFLLGSKLVKNKSFLESSFYKDISSNLFLSYLIVIITIFFLLTLDFLSFNKQNKKNKSDLYESRRSLLKILHEYLQTIDRFSIIGDWGIGKTILIENFFYNSDYSKNYELIYIDSSIYSSNENIIIKLENEIDNILEKYQIVKNKNSFTGDLFLETNTFLKSLYKLIFPQKSSYEIKHSLEKKFTTIEENHKKKIVLCLDNLERNNNSFKIIKLFSILSEILPENIKIIYIYDEIEMKKIFINASKDFIEYISKYTFNKIEVRDIEIEEILESHRGEISNIINKISKKINNPSFISKSLSLFKKAIEDDKNYTNIDKFIEKIEESFKRIQEDISNKLKNPRYVENLIDYLKIKDTEEIILQYKAEYKIALDFFPSLTLNSIKTTSYDLNSYFNISKHVLLGRQLVLSDQQLSQTKIEELFFIFLFKVDSEGKPFDYIHEQNMAFEVFSKYLVDKSLTSFYKELEELKKNPKENFIKILELLHLLFPQDFSSKVKENLTLDEKTEFIIKRDFELQNLIKLIKLNGLDEISQLILPKVVLIENVDNIDRNSFQEYLDLWITIYIYDSPYIRDLLQLNLNISQMQNYLKDGIPGFNDFFKENFEIYGTNNFKKILELLRSFLPKFQKTLKDLNIYNSTEQSLNTLEQLINLKIKKVSLEKEKTIIEISSDFFSDNTGYQILHFIEIKNDEFIIKDNPNFNKITISSENVDDYIDFLEKMLSKNKNKENIRYLLIELIKFRNTLRKANKV